VGKWHADMFPTHTWRVIAGCMASLTKRSIQRHTANAEDTPPRAAHSQMPCPFWGKTCKFHSYTDCQRWPANCSHALTTKPRHRHLTLGHCQGTLGVTCLYCLMLQHDLIEFCVCHDLIIYTLYTLHQHQVYQFANLSCQRRASHSFGLDYVCKSWQLSFTQITRPARCSQVTTHNENQSASLVAQFAMLTTRQLLTCFTTLTGQAFTASGTQLLSSRRHKSASPLWKKQVQTVTC
jgi:hypothetical protein